MYTHLKVVLSGLKKLCERTHAHTHQTPRKDAYAPSLVRAHSKGPEPSIFQQDIVKFRIY